MTIPPESIEVGRCYLTHTERHIRVLRVIAVLPDGRVQYEFQTRTRVKPTSKWTAGILHKDAFARMAEREVPCDWTPERDNEERGTR